MGPFENTRDRIEAFSENLMQSGLISMAVNQLQHSDPEEVAEINQFLEATVRMASAFNIDLPEA